MNIKNTKKIFSLLLALILVISLVPVAAQAATAPTYARVTSFSNGKNYVITVTSGRTIYALTHANNNVSAVQVTLTNGRLTSEVTDDMLWNYSGSKLSYQDNGKTYYLYSGASNNPAGSSTGITLTVSTTYASNAVISGSKVQLGSFYLRYLNGTIKAHKTGGTAYGLQETFA